MSRMVSLVKRVGWMVVIALVVVATAGGSLIAVLTARGLPTTHGTLAIAGLDDAVRVTRDANGIAWIEADPVTAFRAAVKDGCGYVRAAR